MSGALVVTRYWLHVINCRIIIIIPVFGTLCIGALRTAMHHTERSVWPMNPCRQAHVYYQCQLDVVEQDLVSMSTEQLFLEVMELVFLQAEQDIWLASCIGLIQFGISRERKSHPSVMPLLCVENTNSVYMCMYIYMYIYIYIYTLTHFFQKLKKLVLSGNAEIDYHVTL